MGIKSVFKRGGSSIKVEFGTPEETTDRICNDKALGYFMAETFARYMDAYVPMDTGMLAQNYTTKPFEVTYNSPYAHYQYVGEHFNFNKEMHPLATAYWDKAMMQARDKDVIREIEAFMARR